MSTITKNEEKESIAYYAPKVTVEKTLALDQNDTKYASKLGDENGIIKVTLEIEAILQRVSKDIYASPESGFRELFNNEARACRISKKQFNANPRIEVSIDVNEHKLTIHGIDSYGITMQKFNEICSVLGRSDNFAGGEVGQFGMGMAAYTKLSDVMILETYSRETGEKFAVMGKSGIQFQVLPAPEDLNEFGTRITITLKESIDVKDIARKAVETARFCEVDTYMNLSNDLPKSESYSSDAEYLNVFTPLSAGRHKIGSGSYEEFLKYLVTKLESDIKHISTLTIQDEDFDFIGIFAGTTWRGGYSNYHKLPNGRKQEEITCLVNSPIIVDIVSKNMPEFSAYVLNIKDERKYMPAADRERLSEQATKLINKKLEARMLEATNDQLSLKENTIDEYKQSDKKNVYRYLKQFGLCQSPTALHHRDDFPEFVSKETVEMFQFLNIGISETSSGGNSSMHSLVEYNCPLFYLDSLSRNEIDMIKSVEPTAVIFRTEKKYKTGYYYELMERYGVQSGKQFIKENKLRKSKVKLDSTMIVVHKSKYGSTNYGRFMVAVRDTEQKKAHDIDQDTIKIKDGKLKPYLDLLSKVVTKYKIVKDTKTISSGIKLDQFVENIRNKSIKTSEGKLKIHELLDIVKPIEFVIYSDERINGIIKDGIVCTICTSADKIFEIASFLNYHDKNEYTINYSGREEYDALVSSKHLNIDSARSFVTYEHQYGDSEKLLSVIHCAMIAKKNNEEDLFEMFVNAMGNLCESTYGDVSVTVERMRNTLFSTYQKLFGEKALEL